MPGISASSENPPKEMTRIMLTFIRSVLICVGSYFVFICLYRPTHSFIHSISALIHLPTASRIWVLVQRGSAEKSLNSSQEFPKPYAQGLWAEVVLVEVEQ